MCYGTVVFLRILKKTTTRTIFGQVGGEQNQTKAVVSSHCSNGSHTNPHTWAAAHFSGPGSCLSQNSTVEMVEWVANLLRVNSRLSEQNELKTQPQSRLHILYIGPLTHPPTHIYAHKQKRQAPLQRKMPIHFVNVYGLQKLHRDKGEEEWAQILLCSLLKSGVLWEVRLPVPQRSSVTRGFWDGKYLLTTSKRMGNSTPSSLLQPIAYQDVCRLFFPLPAAFQELSLLGCLYVAPQNPRQEYF